jgi:hypothetical protein
MEAKAEQMSILVKGIDPRETNWEEYYPVYRVYFSDGDGATDEWQLTGADSVHAVLAWAEANAVGREFVAYLEVRPAQGIGLVRLVGRAPDEL